MQNGRRVVTPLKSPMNPIFLDCLNKDSPHSSQNTEVSPFYKNFRDRDLIRNIEKHYE
jgi:hypothetical protein